MLLPSWVPDAETKPAPMPLLVVQSFVNTWEAETGADLLGDQLSAAGWLREAGLADAAADGSGQPVLPDLTTLREVRDEIRDLVVANAEASEPAAPDLGALRRIVSASPMHLALDAVGGVDLAPDDGEWAWAVRLLLIVRDAQQDGTWKRLKACRNQECLWAFYDRSHAGRGAWCDMAVCGNRIKNRNLRLRRAAAEFRASPSGAP